MHVVSTESLPRSAPPFHAFLVLTSLLALLGSGCCGHFRCARRHTVMPLGPEVAKSFAWPLVVETNTTEKLIATTRHYSAIQFTLAALTNGSGNSRELVLDCFRPTRQTNAPVILILPML